MNFSRIKKYLFVIEVKTAETVRDDLAPNDDVAPLTPEERAMIAKTDLTEQQYTKSTGVPAVWGDAAYNIRERIAARPTLDVNGLWSGWSGPGPTARTRRRPAPPSPRAWTNT